MSSQSVSLPEPTIHVAWILMVTELHLLHEVCGKIIQTLALGCRGINVPLMMLP